MMTHNESAGNARKRRRGSVSWQTITTAVGFFLGVGGACLIVSTHTGSTSPEPAPPLPAKNVADVHVPASTANLAAEKQRLQTEVDRARLQREVVQLRAELSDLRSVANHQATPAKRAATPAANEPLPRPRAERSPQPQLHPGKATLRYWQAMNQIIRQEAAMRRAPLGGINQGNANSFLSRRQQAYTFAADRLGRLKTINVDPLAIAVAKDVRGWYLAGRDISAQASSLLGAGTATRQGAAGKSWQDDEKAHNASVQGVNARAEQSRRSLQSKYGLAFPRLE